MSVKSASSCYPEITIDVGILLLCEVLVEEPASKPMLELRSERSDAAEVAKEQGSIATWARGMNDYGKWMTGRAITRKLDGTTMVDTNPFVTL